MRVLEREPKSGPVVPPQDEIPAIEELRKALDQGTPPLFLHLPVDQVDEVEIPSVVTRVLLRIATEIAKGRAIAVIPYDEELTTQQAADLLGVSRPFLIRLLKQENIPYRMVGTHRRIPLVELLEYKERRGPHRREQIRQMAEDAEEMGLDS